MTWGRKLSLLGLCLSIVQGVVSLTDRDGSAETAGEIAMLATVFGGKAASPHPGGNQAGTPDLLTALQP